MTVSHRYRTTNACHYGPGRYALGVRLSSPFGGGRYRSVCLTWSWIHSLMAFD